MFSIRPLPEFSAWLDKVEDKKVQAAIAARIRRLSFGLFGDVESVGGGISELRIHTGSGWRIYFVKRGQQIIVLLAGGTKRTQSADIKRAKALAGQLE